MVFRLSADINIKNANNSFALSSNNGKITNSGTLTISNPDGALNETAYAIQVLGKGDVTNEEAALITIDGYNNAYAISSASGNVSNAADININQNSNLQTELAYGIQAQILILKMPMRIMAFHQLMEIFLIQVLFLF